MVDRGRLVDANPLENLEWIANPHPLLPQNAADTVIGTGGLPVSGLADSLLSAHGEWELACPGDVAYASDAGSDFGPACRFQICV